MKYIKKTALVLVGILVLGMLSGCGSRREAAKETELQPMSYENLMKQWKSQAKQDFLTCWFTSETDRLWLEEMAAEFQQEYGVKVQLVCYDGVSLFEDMNKENQKGQGPELYLLGNDQLQLAVESGMAMENTWYDESFWQENYPEVAKNAVTYREKQYGYPVYFDTYCLVYDANLLETAPASIEDIITFLDAYEDTGSTKAVFRWDVADSYINSMFLASYANLFGENGDNPSKFQVNNEKCVEAMQYFQSLSAYLWMNKSNISHDTIVNRIKDGTLVLGLCKSDILPTLYEMQEGKTASIPGATTEETTEESTTEGNAPAENVATNYQVSYVPSLTADLSSTAFSTTYAAMVNPYGGDESLGNMFAMYLSIAGADRQYAGNGKLPVVNREESFDGLQKVVYAQYLNSKPVPKVMLLGDYLSESGIVFDAIWEGMDAKEQLDKLQQTMDEKLQ